MASLNASKTPHDYSPDKCMSSSVSNISLDESDTSVHAKDVNMNQDSFLNIPSPCSTGTTSTIDRSFKFRTSRLRSKFENVLIKMNENSHSCFFFLYKTDDSNPKSSSKPHFRHDKLFHLTHSLNRQYVIAMTNILFQMQKEIYKLKRRMYNVEQTLSRQKPCSHPIIRIPRLTKGTPV